MDNNLTTKPLPSLIPRKPIMNSTLLYEVGYDPATETLVVLFRDRKGNAAGVYAYKGVPQQIYDDLADPEFVGSKGRYFTELVRKAGYEHQRLEENDG